MDDKDTHQKPGAPRKVVRMALNGVVALIPESREHPGQPTPGTARDLARREQRARQPSHDELLAQLRLQSPAGLDATACNARRRLRQARAGKKPKLTSAERERIARGGSTS